MLVVIPMNGTGERFKQAGFKEPKPFILWRGKPIFQWVLDYLPKQYKLLIACREEYVQRVRQMAPTATIRPMDHNTSGPLDTLLSPDVFAWICWRSFSILIQDGDSFFENPVEIEKAIDTFEKSESNGGVTTRTTSDSACSFVSVTNSLITEAKEKDAFTTTSSTGPYWFRSGHLFTEYGSTSLSKGVTSIAPVYNEMIKDGHTVQAYPVKSFVHLGTPEALSSPSAY